VNEVFDRIVEIGMFEHVGPKNYRTFMEVCHRCLKENGLVMLHTIGSNKTCVKGDEWLLRYIFPGGKLPSIAEIGKSIENLFVMEDWHNFGLDYARTTKAWLTYFENNWDKIKSSYPDPFYRMWTYYLNCSSGGFKAREMQLWQIVLSKNRLPGGYESV
jgi:cyclopropane-fatty-acyl-phospholipid synthase